MMMLQNSYYSSVAADAVPLFLKHLLTANLNATEQQYLDEVKRWDFNDTPDSRACTIYQAWMDSLKALVWEDQFSKIRKPNTNSENVRPDEQTLLEALLKAPSFKYLDNVNTPEKETLERAEEDKEEES